MSHRDIDSKKLNYSKVYSFHVYSFLFTISLCNRRAPLAPGKEYYSVLNESSCTVFGLDSCLQICIRGLDFSGILYNFFTMLDIEALYC
jgi:hypothetical protein